MELFSPEAVLGAVRYAWAALTHRRVAVTGSCLRCGRCCERLCIQMDGGFVETLAHFEELKAGDARYERFEVTGRDTAGSLVFRCLMLDGGKCADYPGRLEFCRDYPTVNLFFLGQNLLPGCGYRFEVQ